MVKADKEILNSIKESTTIADKNFAKETYIKAVAALNIKEKEGSITIDYENVNKEIAIEITNNFSEFISTVFKWQKNITPKTFFEYSSFMSTIGSLLMILS